MLNKHKDTHEDGCDDKSFVGHGVHLAEAAVALVLASQAQPVDAVPAADLGLKQIISRYHCNNFSVVLSQRLTYI